MKISSSGLVLLLAWISDASIYTDASSIVNIKRSASCISDSTHRVPFLAHNQGSDNNVPSYGKSAELLLALSRGGSIEDESEYDYEDESEELSEDEEVEEVKQKTLSASTLSAIEKTKNKKAAEATSKSKAAVNASLQKSKPKKKKPSVSLLKKLRVPYIVRACLNPLTVFSMTRAYFASLFNINYMEEESSQGLRSALEAKAKQEAASGGRKGKRSMKPGRSKSLADLPQLSA